MVYFVKSVLGDNSQKMIVACPQPTYPQIIRKQFERVYLSKLVPPTYEFHRRALRDLETVHCLLMSKVEHQTGTQQKTSTSRLAAVCYQLGHAYYDTVDGVEMAETLFTRALSVVEDVETDPDNVISVINSLNMLAFLEVNHTSNTEKALQYLDRADTIYKAYCDARPALPEPTNFETLLVCCPRTDRTGAEKLYKRRPIINARLYTLFYYIEIYKILKLTEKEVFYAHAALKLQMDNDVYMQCPLDWIQTCTHISEVLLNANAFQQAKHHMAAASMFIDEVIPKNFSYYKDSVQIRQYTADVSFSWSRYGMRLLENSKTKLMNNTIHANPPSIFNDLLFDQFIDLHGGKDVPIYVSTYDEAEKLARDTIDWIDGTTQYYTFDMSVSFFTYISIDKCHTFKNLASFETNPNKKAKLLKKGLEDMEYIVFRLDENDLKILCRQMWFELGSNYREMMDIKFEQHVVLRKEVSNAGGEKINEYSKSSILFFIKFINSFPSFPDSTPELKKKPFLLCHLQLAKCYDKQISYTKADRLNNISESEKYYKKLIDYCEAYPELQELIPTELAACREMLRAIPMKIELVSKKPITSKYFL